MDYVKSVSMINSLEEEIGPNLKLRNDAVLRFITANENWYKNVQTLKTEARESKNYFAYYNAIINEVKVSYEFEVYTDMVFIVQELPGIPKPEMPDNHAMFERMLERITKTHNYFYHIGPIHNTVAALATKYEILHYLNRSEEANNIMNDLQTIIETFDIAEQREKLKILKNNGTTHQQFQIWMDKIFGEADAKKKAYEDARDEMIKIDREESKIKDKSKGDNLHINLFPIGYFQFPADQKKIVYEILNVTEEAKEILMECLK
ncbi:MAG: hypothetical protein IPJ26_17035 [Bacteroidetes bacterium]|nr:hypothetical protein [Bacteroidota bacterium]